MAGGADELGNCSEYRNRLLKISLEGDLGIPSLEQRLG